MWFILENIPWGVALASCVLTEVMLSNKIKTKDNISKKVLFWIVAICIYLCLCEYLYLCRIRGGVYSVSYSACCVFPLIIIPLRIVFELVLIGMSNDRNVTSKNNQSESRLYRSNYSANTQNNKRIW